MKKALVSTMSLIVSAALLSGAALTASAGYEKVVIATEKGGVLLDEDFKLGNGTYQKYSGEDRVLQYGDVIVFGGDGLKDVSIDPIDQFPHYYNFPDDPSDFSIKYLGTAEEVYADNIKELTVTQALENGCVRFVDADGQACTWHTSVDKWLTDTGYYQYDFTTPDGFHPSDYQVGDVVRCVMEEDGKSVLLPLTPAPEHTPIKGDVDCNGTVNIMDVILLNRNLMVGAEISEQGMKNALTNTTGIAPQSDDTQRQPDAVDALNILKYIVRLIPEL